jgi:hypothetical protein
MREKHRRDVIRIGMGFTFRDIGCKPAARTGNWLKSWRGRSSGVSSAGISFHVDCKFARANGVNRRAHEGNSEALSTLIDQAGDAPVGELCDSSLAERWL